MQRHVFRGVTASQQALVRHWLVWRDVAGQACPRRSQADPGTLRRFLAHLSILELDGRGGAVFRLAGSRLRPLLGLEARGCSVDSLPASLSEIWGLGLDAAVERIEPVGGVITRRDTSGRHAWLRMPLVDTAGRVSLILCHDEWLAATPAETPPPRVDAVAAA